MIDVVHQINATQRAVGDRVLESGEARAVTITRTYAATAEDVWDACTSAERIARWFLPISGDLRLGGRYALEGNASGTIERCDPPRSFAATWEYAGHTSWIEVRLAPDGPDRTRFELEHLQLVTDHWVQFGPGATGIGWDLGLLGLGIHLEAPTRFDPAELAQWATSEEAKTFMSLSSAAWRDAYIEGGADRAEAEGMAERTETFYLGTDAPAPS